MPVTTPTSPQHEIAADEALAVGVVLRAAEVAVAVFFGLLICPPLLILAVVVVVPLLAVAIVLGAVAAVLAAPYLLVRHVVGHHRDHRSSAVAHNLRRLGLRHA